MGDFRGAPGFGQVDLDIEDEPSAPTSKKPSHRNFGELDLDLGDAAQAEEAPPPSRSRVFGPSVARSFAVHEESTRIVSGEALAAITGPPPGDPLQEEGSTRAWGEIDDALLLVGEGPAPPPSPARMSSRPPSGSGVASRDGRVAAMRELYANGDADGALALATSLGGSMAPPATGDHPDASIVVEIGEQSIDTSDASDPFGGLIPMDSMGDKVASTAAMKPPAAHLTLTERQSIPRLLKSMAEVSTLKIDHRAGFLLAHVDGMQTLEEILDICAMPPAEALELIANLKKMGVIEFE